MFDRGSSSRVQTTRRDKLFRNSRTGETRRDTCDAKYPAPLPQVQLCFEIHRGNKGTQFSSTTRYEKRKRKEKIDEK